ERQQCLPHLERALPALRTRLRERPRYYRGEFPGHVAPQAVQVGRRVVLMHVEHGRRTGRRDRRAAREALEQDHAEGVEVRTAVHVGNPCACSGLMYSSVPTTNPLRVTRSSPELAMALAIPRSTRTAPCGGGASTMLSGLMS